MSLRTRVHDWLRRDLYGPDICGHLAAVVGPARPPAVTYPGDPGRSPRPWALAYAAYAAQTLRDASGVAETASAGRLGGRKGRVLPIRRGSLPSPEIVALRGGKRAAGGRRA